MTVLRLAWQSLWNRRATASLTVLAVALSVTMLLGVEKVRRDAELAFANTISGTDLIVGARSGPVPLLLYSVFRIGDATNNISWDSYQWVASNPKVHWTVPLSLGDSHRGYRVLGTTAEYFERYRYGAKQPLRIAEGARFDDLYDAVLGATVAKQLGYELGEEIVLAHGAGAVSFTKHDDKPFRVSGILAPTGTPVDRTVHISLEGIEALHVDWKDGAPKRGERVSAEVAKTLDLQPTTITAFLVGLDSRLAIFNMQREINNYRREPLLAIIPGVALQQLWDLLGVAEQALRWVAVMVVVTGVLGLLTVILATLEARRREMAVLRAVGARPVHVFALFTTEALVLGVAGIALGVVLLYTAVAVARPIAASLYGLYLPITPLQGSDLMLLAGVLAGICLAGAVPALRAYRLSLADGLSVRT